MMPESPCGIRTGEVIAIISICGNDGTKEELAECNCNQKTARQMSASHRNIFERSIRADEYLVGSATCGKYGCQNFQPAVDSPLTWPSDEIAVFQVLGSTNNAS